MSASQLPENMGKKIVEALKRRTMYGNDFVPEHSEIMAEEESPIVEEQSVLDNAEEYTFDDNEEVELEPQMNLINSSGIPAFSTFASDLPTNVMVLKKLVSQLPAGVSKQVGVQIIRQTMEALGISMSGVLKEAQEVHNGLSTAIQECTKKVQEHRKEIIQLENNIRDFQRQVTQINDIIGVFVMTNKK